MATDFPDMMTHSLLAVCSFITHIPNNNIVSINTNTNTNDIIMEDVEKKYLKEEKE